MGFAQPLAGPQTQQESVSSVLGQVQATLSELESRLTNLRDRLEMRPTGTSNAKLDHPSSGLLHQSLEARNSTQRLMDLCQELDMLL